MVNKEALIAPCGMNCSLCIAYQFKEYDLNKKGFHKTYCSGCIPRGKNCIHMGDGCELLGKGKVRFCFECEDYPCKMLKVLDKRYRTKYHMSMIENLNTIRKMGLDKFLEREEEKWKCLECGGLICCHNGLCMHCHLDTLLQNKKYRWNEENDLKNYPEQVAKVMTVIQRKPEFSSFVESVLSNPDMIGILLEIIRTDKGSTKFYCDKVIRKISETHPSLVYPYFLEISQLIDSSNNFIKWGALLTISNLITVDHERRFDAIYNKYFDLINSDSMITAANVVGNAWKFIQAMPDKEDDITSRLLRVPENTYLYKGEPSPECKNILIGHILDCFDQYFEVSHHPSKMMEFAEAQKNNSRQSTAKKATMFLKKHKS